MRKLTVNTRLGKRIKKIRKEKRLSQEDVAHKANIHYTTLSRIERGISSPPTATVERIAHALGVKISRLFNF